MPALRRPIPNLRVSRFLQARDNPNDAGMSVRMRQFRVPALCIHALHRLCRSITELCRSSNSQARMQGQPAGSPYSILLWSKALKTSRVGGSSSTTTSLAMPGRVAALSRVMRDVCLNRLSFV
jgi:hypothetical protein